MDNHTPTTRKKTLLLLATLLTSLGFIKVAGKGPINKAISCGKDDEPMRLLTQDGKLVEVERKHISSKIRTAEKEEVKTWIHQHSKN